MFKKCVVCNQIINRKNKRFCSVICYGKWVSKEKVEEKAFHWKGGGITKKCKKCGKEFITKKSLSRVECCSIRCSKLGIIPWNKKENRENILNNNRDRQSEQYKKWRISVYKKDFFTCQHCHKKCDNKNIVAHHIHYFANFPELRFSVKNGITLCRSCHLLLHKKNKNIDSLIISTLTQKENLKWLLQEYK